MMLGALWRFVVGLLRSRGSLVAENELLRQQLVVAKCRPSGKRVRWSPAQRWTIAVLARWTGTWRTAVTLVQPATVLRWHREGFRLFWRWRSRPGGPEADRPRGPHPRSELEQSPLGRGANPGRTPQAKTPRHEANNSKVHEEAAARRRPALGDLHRPLRHVGLRLRADLRRAVSASVCSLLPRPKSPESRSRRRDMLSHRRLACTASEERDVRERTPGAGLRS